MNRPFDDGWRRISRYYRRRGVDARWGAAHYNRSEWWRQTRGPVLLRFERQSEVGNLCEPEFRQGEYRHLVVAFGLGVLLNNFFNQLADLGF